MKRRHFIQLGLAGMVGCDNENSANEVKSLACPFAVNIPEKWQRSAVFEKVPILPLFSREGWKIYQNGKTLDLKPGYINRPQHWAIQLPAASPAGIASTRQENTGDDPSAPQILIHKAVEWSMAFTDGEHQEKKTEETLRLMREKMDLALTQDVPDVSPGYVDASLRFMCLKRRLDFTGGHGIRLVAQWTIEPELMRFGELHYLFLGMSDDNSVQIIATFPLNLPDLPNVGEKSHLGWSTLNYAEFSNSYDEYQQEAKKWLEQRADKIAPSLRELDGMIQSLVANQWKES